MTRPKTTRPLKSKIDVPWDTTGGASAPQSMPLDQIVLPATQPRRYFDPEALKQLTESIKQHGILQPLLVRPVDGGKHEVVAGERRYRAATEIALKEVPVVIKELDDNAAFQLALIEKLLREDLNPVEETEGILQLLAHKLGRSVEDVPPLLRRLQHERKEAANSSNNVIGKAETSEQQELTLENSDLKIVESVFESLGLMTWESFANNRLPLLNLPVDILDALRDGSIEYTKAKAIAQISLFNERFVFLDQAIA